MAKISDIVLMDALALGTAIRAKKLSCVEVMTAFLDHIDRFNPAANAIVSLRPRAELLAEARERDALLARGEILGPLHGLPQAIKDLVGVKGLPTTLGSPLFRDNVATADALFVERTRNAGAIIIGKTNVPEFGLGSHTFNPVFGPSHNAYDPTKTVGGSSGGAGVALALRLLPVADGSDHGGSLRNPAAFNNVIALRPTYGRVPNTEEDAFMPGFSVIGPMARNVPDLQMLLAVQSGYDARQPYSIPEPQSFATPPLALDPKGKRIGWIGDFGGHIPFEAGVLDLCRNALRTLQGLGCAVEDVTPDFDAEKIFQNWALLRSWGNWKRIAPLYADPEKRKQLKPEAIWEFERCQTISGIDVRVAAGVRTEWYNVVRKLFERYDYLVLPSAQLFPFDIETHWPAEIAGKKMDTYHRWMEVMIPVTFSGCPAIGVPVGFGARGLPMGMQIVGPMRSEQALMQIAHVYDQATQWVTKALPPALKAVVG